MRKLAGNQFAQVTFTLNELVQFMPDNNDKHDKLRAALRGVGDKSLNWYQRDQRAYYNSRLISGFKIDTVRSQVLINIDPFMLPVLCDLKKEFTIFQLQALLALKSKFSKRIYLMCCQFISTGIMHIALDDLRARLDLLGKYSDYSDLAKRVLKVATQEINAHSELVIELLPGKEGKTITHSTFLITLKKEAAKVATDDRARNFLKTQGLADWQITNIFAQLPADEVRQLLYHYQHYQKTVRNKGAYLAQVFTDAGVNMYKKLSVQVSLLEQIKSDEQQAKRFKYSRARQKFAAA